MNIPKLPDQLIIALGQYYLNRQLSHPRQTGSHRNTTGQLIKEYDPGKKWNKTVDLERISHVCSTTRHGFQASAGTFWISHRDFPQFHYIKMKEDSWPIGQFYKHMPVPEADILIEPSLIDEKIDIREVVERLLDPDL